MKDQTHLPTVLTREDVTAQILAARKAAGMTWEALAEAIGMSPVFTHSAAMGMNAFPAEKAQALAKVLDLDPGAAELLSEPPTKIWSQAVPTDPCLYRLYEIVGVYGPTIKALIEEKFGTGIMSAIDFEMHLTREPNPKGDPGIAFTHAKKATDGKEAKRKPVVITMDTAAQQAELSRVVRTHRASAPRRDSIWALVPEDALAPAPVAAKAPAATAHSMAARGPLDQDAASAPANASPAPVVSTASTFGAGTSNDSEPRYLAPRAPSVVTTCSMFFTRLPMRASSASLTTRTSVAATRASGRSWTGDGLSIVTTARECAYSNAASTVSRGISN